MCTLREWIRINRQNVARGFYGCIGILCLVHVANSVYAGDTESSIVSFEVVDDASIPMPLTDTPGDLDRGREVVADRKLGNCLACHQINAMNDFPFHGNIAPSLNGVADRYESGEIRLLVINPKIAFPETVMPAFYRVNGLHRVAEKFQGKPILTAQQIEDVVAFLMTLQD